MKRLTHVYTGDGKGKTTASLGLAFRAWGRGWRIRYYQFLKSRHSGEMTSAEVLGERFLIRRGMTLSKFTWDMTPAEKIETTAACHALLSHAHEEMVSGACDMLVLDEVIGALHGGFLELQTVIDFVSDKPEGVELVLTGRRAPEALILLADYVSDIQPVKHPMNNGISAREGIED